MRRFFDSNHNKNALGSTDYTPDDSMNGLGANSAFPTPVSDAAFAMFERTNKPLLPRTEVS